MNKNIIKLIEVFKSSPYMLDMGAKKIASRQKVDVEDVYEAKKAIKAEKNKFINTTCDELGIDSSLVKNFWYKDKDRGVSINAKTIEQDHTQEILAAFDDLISEYKTKGIKTFTSTKLKNPKALKVTITDDHIGMNPNPNENGGLFQYEYNGDIYKASLGKVYNSVIKEYNTHGTFDLLLLDNLGDQEDGWDGLTTRGGHTLEQNMTNAEMFEVCVDSKIQLVESLVSSKVANKIILRSVTNSNHSNDFSIIVNKAIQKIINRIYSTDIVEVEILERFIEHRVYGDHTFLLCHGKDAKQMFKGLPLILNDKTINYINDYIDFYNIDSKYIHFEKADLHQLGYQKVKKFDYRNFMSFAPPSAWQQHNFGDSYSGYSIQVIPKYSNEISHTDYFLDYRKTK